uniref:CH-like domain-containing protein n=1 Tax=Pelodiscus sinensis TaxID=13735 RepID=K7G8M9_PELSI
LAAEVVKFYFPKMVEMHNYVPANSTQQKLSNWSHLNRKVLSKLNFSIPADVIRKIVQCTPGAVELVLIPLRQRIEEKQSKAVSGAHKAPGMRPRAASDWVGAGTWRGGRRVSPVAIATSGGGGATTGQQAGGMDKGQQVYAQGVQGDPNFGAHLAQRKTSPARVLPVAQILQMKVRRLEHLLHLKNVRIDDLTRRLQQVEQKRK